VSLNPAEQRIFDYLQSRPDEGRFWREKVRAIAAQPDSSEAIATRLERELWRYHEERSATASPFREAALREGRARTSLRNLAELLLRLWTEPRPKKKPGGDDPINAPK
jgi:hypothetical protein